ncbi:MAG: NINE protein [Methyloprofundus sp.]|nr:NINE protein [Methyloprofundus sp.]
MNSHMYGTPVDNSGVKYQSIALIFAITGGFLALDRFYLGHRTLGLIKLFSFGGFGLWVVVDFVLILLNSLKDSNGESMVQG